MQTVPFRSIVHMDLDAFFVSVERLKDSRLNGLPLIIGGTGDRGVVSSCSYEARAFGVRSAMPMRSARRLCPHGIVISGDFEAYSEYSHLVTEIIGERSPLMEKASVDEFYIDLTGMERFFGCWKWASEMRQRVIKETGLPISFGLSVNKMVSKVATNEAKPAGQLEVPERQVLDFLAPMHVQKIPLIGTETARQLAYLGVRNVATLRQIPRDALEHAFGKTGRLLYCRARGEDDSPVVAHSERKSISTERTFRQDTMDMQRLRSLLVHMTEKVAYQLRHGGKLTACVTVKIRYSNFETLTRQAHISYTAEDRLLIEKVLQLFDRLYQKRVRLRLIGVKLSQLVPGGRQIRLFESHSRQVGLYEAIDQIKDKYGTSALKRGSVVRQQEPTEVG